MNNRFRIVALGTAVAYIVSVLAGCGSPQTRYTEDGVEVTTIGATENQEVDRDRVAVVGRIQIVEKAGAKVDSSSDLAIYILRDVYSPNDSLPDWSLGQLAHLQTKPFATDQSGYFRIALPRGRYYPQLIYRKKDLGVFSINPNVRMDVSDAGTVAYAGTLTLTIDGQRLDKLKNEGASERMLVEGAASLVVSNDFPKDRQRLVEGLGSTAEDSVSQRLLMVDPSTVPNVLTSEAILTADQKASRATKILLQTGALILLLPLIILLGLSGGTVDFGH